LSERERRLRRPRILEILKKEGKKRKRKRKREGKKRKGKKSIL
jgi:hypothetical protein